MIVYYLDQNFCKQSVILGIEPLDKYDSETISYFESLEKKTIDLRCVGGTSDGASNMLVHKEFWLD